jgi:hypothetical protein
MSIRDTSTSFNLDRMTKDDDDDDEEEENKQTNKDNDETIVCAFARI